MSSPSALLSWRVSIETVEATTMYHLTLLPHHCPGTQALFTACLQATVGFSPRHSCPESRQFPAQTASQGDSTGAQYPCVLEEPAMGLGRRRREERKRRKYEEEEGGKREEEKGEEGSIEGRERGRKVEGEKNGEEKGGEEKEERGKVGKARKRREEGGREEEKREEGRRREEEAGRGAQSSSREDILVPHENLNK